MNREFTRALVCHPQASPGAAAVEVVLRVDGAGDWYLRYGGGAAGGLAFPSSAPAGAADELWRHTCCELFVARPGASGYREFNFSPSGQWAIYDFDAYRHRAGSVLDGGPSLAFRRDADQWRLAATVPAALLPEGPVEVALCAVLESGGGGVSHWALEHPASCADFHDRRGFILRLP